MRHLKIEKKKINLQSFRHRKAEESDCPELIDEDVTITLHGKSEPCLVYKTNVETGNLIKACEKIKFRQNDKRTSGVISTSRVFGYAPRNELWNRPCRETAMAQEIPSEHEEIVKSADTASKFYHRYAPKMAKKHQWITDNYVLAEYRLGSSMFTSGIVNENNPLLYHFDKGNYSGRWSAMFTYKRDIEGGHLAIPEMGISFKCSSNCLVMFDGQSFLHGVTPIVKRTKKARRWTAVFYSLKNMWNCEPYTDEVEAMRATRTLTEISKAKK